MLSDKSTATVTTAEINEKVDEDDDPFLNSGQAAACRKVAARANFLAQDRPDLQFATKCLSQGMSNPRQSHWRALERLAKYLKGRPRYIVRYEYQPRGYVLNTFTDSDWAGDTKTRRSTSGGLVCIGDHCIRSWSSTQTTIALSTGEAEYYALVKGVSVAMGIRALLEDLGVDTII